MRRNKHNAVKVELDGYTFDSKKEAARYCDLVLLERAGEIKHLAVHFPYSITVNGVHVCNYEADFTYEQGGKTVVEDVKSEWTRTLPVYRIKRKLMLACHGIEIAEV